MKESKEQIPDKEVELVATQGKRMFHSCISLDYLAEHLDAFDCSPNEALQAITRARAKGYEFWPGCDNVDNRGHCAGHKTIEKPR